VYDREVKGKTPIKRMEGGKLDDQRRVNWKLGRHCGKKKKKGREAKGCSGPDCVRLSQDVMPTGRLLSTN